MHHACIQSTQVIALQGWACNGIFKYSKTCASLKKTETSFQLSLMHVQGEHSAILSTFIKLTFVIKIFVLSIFERPFNTGFTVGV